MRVCEITKDLHLKKWIVQIWFNENDLESLTFNNRDEVFTTKCSTTMHSSKKNALEYVKYIKSII